MGILEIFPVAYLGTILEVFFIMEALKKEELEKLQAELHELEANDIIIDGKHLKPSNCYYVGSNPLHILYNTNCPDTLKQSIENILAKYKPTDEDRP